jgi:hypothetical protein
MISKVSILSMVLLHAVLLSVANGIVWASEGDSASVYGCYGFADSSGTHVLALSRLQHPENIRVLLAGEGRRFPVRYEGEQKRTQGGDGRDAVRNFAFIGGQRFRIEGGAVWPDESCFLATDTLLVWGRSLEVESAFKECGIDEGGASQLEAMKHRKVSGCWHLASLGDDWLDGFVDLYQFAPVGSQYLASLVLYSNEPPVICDFPAEMKDSSSVWRVDDEGDIHADGFRVLFVLKGDQGYLMGLSSLGEEGEDLHLLRSTGKTGLKIIHGDYRYLAPT